MNTKHWHLKSSVFRDRSSSKFLGWMCAVPRQELEEIASWNIRYQSKIISWVSPPTKYNFSSRKTFSFFKNKKCEKVKSYMIYVHKWKVPQIELEYTRQWNFEISSFENAFDGWARRSMELRNFEELLRNLARLYTKLIRLYQNHRFCEFCEQQVGFRSRIL